MTNEESPRHRLVMALAVSVDVMHQLSTCDNLRVSGYFQDPHAPETFTGFLVAWNRPEGDDRIIRQYKVTVEELPIIEKASS